MRHGLSKLVGLLSSVGVLAACGGVNNFSSPAMPAAALRAAPPLARTDPQQPLISRAASGGVFHETGVATSSETVLYSFAGGSDGAVPANDVLLALNGKFYGITRSGGGSGCGGSGCGTVFKATSSGGETVLYRFQGGYDGRYPKGGLVERNGVLYGTTQGGGSYGGGTFFKVTTAGKETVLHNFGAVVRSGYDGYSPYGRLIYVAATGKFYGTTISGGIATCGCGTVFSVTPSGKETILHSFAGAPDGNFLTGSLIYNNGYLYGTSQLGGSGNASACTGTSGVVGCGTIFRVSTSGAEKVLYNFTGGADGAFPDAGLIDVSGKFYGMTGGGFTSSGCDPNCGNVFSVTTSGTLHVIHTFAGPPSDGASPFGNLTNVKGVLYGATQYGGSDTACPGFSGVTGCGVVFRVTTSGKERVLYSFQGSPDGSTAQTSLLESGGVLYGTTDFGGSGCAPSGGCGTIFSITP